MWEIKLVAGSSNQGLAQQISRKIGVPLTSTTLRQFSDGETFIQINENIRGTDVYIVQSTSSPVNDNLMELLLIVDACKRSSCGQITVVIPYSGYSRFDKRQRDARVPISAKLIADLITAAGAHRVLTMELHTNQIQGFFDIPMDHLQFNDILCKYLAQEAKDCMVDVADDKLDVAISVAVAGGKVKHREPSVNNLKALEELEKQQRAKLAQSAPAQDSDINPAVVALKKKFVIVAAGKRGTSRAKYIAERLGCSLAVLDGRKGLPESDAREPDPVEIESVPKQSSVPNFFLLGDVQDCECVLVDDIIDTAKTICDGYEVLVRHGAKRVIAAGVHAVLSHEGIERLKTCPVEKIICSNSIACEHHNEVLGGRLKVLDASGLFSEAIRRIHFQETLEGFMTESM